MNADLHNAEPLQARSRGAEQQRNTSKQGRSWDEMTQEPFGGSESRDLPEHTENIGETGGQSGLAIQEAILGDCQIRPPEEMSRRFSSSS